MRYWLVKSEPSVYAWADFLREGRAVWSGVRNFQARNHLQQMRVGDRVFFYHSQTTKDIVGIAEVVATAYPDPTIPDDPRWVVVDLVPVAPLVVPVTLAQIKVDAVLKTMGLVTQSRLSVMPLDEGQFLRVMELSK